MSTNEIVDRGNFYIKWQDDSYSKCAFNQDGNIYIFYLHLVQRGMGHQLVKELLIIGMNKSRISDFLKRKNAIIVWRDKKVEEKIFKNSEVL